MYCNPPYLDRDGNIVYDDAKLAGCCPHIENESSHATTQCFNSITDLIQPFTVGGQEQLVEPNLYDGYYYKSAEHICIQKPNNENPTENIECPL